MNFVNATIMASEKMYPANHKTLFVLDHTPYFGIPCECLIEFDFTKSRGPGFIPLAPMSKSLWTCSVEAAIEYCRIAWDIFPTGKLVRFIISDALATSLNTWNQNQMSIHYLLNGLSGVGVPPPLSRVSDYSVIHGLQAAAQALCEASELQHEYRNSLNENASKVLNRCRVVCITSARDNPSIKSIEEIFLNELIQANKFASASDHLIPVHHCHLVLINVHPNNMDNVGVTSRPLTELSPILSSEVHCSKAGGQIASKLMHLILSHYNLASTTVTGIPMKEDQNASSSANYDVEIYHPSEVHDSILKGNSTDIAVIKDSGDYESVTLKWCTPRGSSAGEMHNCNSMHRVSPVDVNSRHSLCLINFLLNGRSVMLEMVRRGGGKMISHLLISHGNEIFIHSLNTARSILEDPPSISEGGGGRVTDYRITDFGMLMQMNRLVPLKVKPLEKNQTYPIEKMKSRLDRFTKYWPMTISLTTVFNHKMYTEPLLSHMLKDTLTDEEVVQCKQCIYALITLESKHEPLQVPSTGHGHRGKGPKREEQYRMLWTELESYIRAHCRSDQHSEVLHCLLECRNKDSDDKVKVELDQALRELDQMTTVSSSSASTSITELTQRSTVIRATTDSPMSPPMQTVRTRPLNNTITLLDMWIAKERAENAKNTRPEFAGRLLAEPLPGGSIITKLYPNLKIEPTGNNRDPSVSMES